MLWIVQRKTSSLRASAPFPGCPDQRCLNGFKSPYVTVRIGRAEFITSALESILVASTEQMRHASKTPPAPSRRILRGNAPCISDAVARKTILGSTGIEAWRPDILRESTRIFCWCTSCLLGSTCEIGQSRLEPDKNRGRWIPTTW